VEFDIFMEARVKFPTPKHLLNVKFPPLGDLLAGLSVFQDGGHVKFPALGQRLSVQIPPQGKAL